MKNTLIYPAGHTHACFHAASFLKQSGFRLTDHPQPDITHILLDVPSIRTDFSESDLVKLLSMVPLSATVIGGNLDHPVFSEHKKTDLLKDADYLAQNAAITAQCAIGIACSHMDATFPDSPALILGWGRIGKCLARLLKSLDCPVTVAARRENDRAMIRALGYATLDYNLLPKQLSSYQLLFNTVPAKILSGAELSAQPQLLKIELASTNGLDSDDLIIARGLPGKYAPVSSGKLIADTFYRLWKGESR